MNFGTFAEEQWKNLVLPTLKLSTQHGYKTVLSKHLLPYWRDWRLRDVGKLDVQQWVAEKFRQQQGWQTVRNAWVLLSSVLETAVEYGYLTSNPARGVKFPQKELKEAPTLIAGEKLATLLQHVAEPYRTMVTLIAATGLRIGELLALRWRSVDLDLGTLTVRESVYEGKFQRPKTQRAMRTIPLGPHAIASLKAHRTIAARLELDDLVFGNRRGLPMRESKLLRRVLQPAGRAVGLGPGDLAPIPSHSFLAPERSARPREDRAGAVGARQHFDDAQHLYARSGRVASDGDRSARARIVPRCSQVAGRERPARSGNN